MSNIKKVTKKNKSIKSAVKKMQKITFVASIIATIMIMSTMTAFATPSGANTTTMHLLRLFKDTRMKMLVKEMVVL